MSYPSRMYALSPHTFNLYPIPRDFLLSLIPLRIFAKTSTYCKVNMLPEQGMSKHHTRRTQVNKEDKKDLSLRSEQTRSV